MEAPPSHRRRARLRAVTYLAPGLPLELFGRIVDHLGRALACDVELKAVSRHSGPMHGDDDPFAAGSADIGFLCSPSYLYLHSQPRPSVELVPAAFVFEDARHDGEPVYFSEVVVRQDHPARRFDELTGGVWGFNDECSLSGYFAPLRELSQKGCDESFFAREVRTGSHPASVDALLRGEIDGAAIDSVVLACMLREHPELAERLRVVESWGPFPIQPVVVHSGLGPGWREEIAAALLQLEAGVSGLAAFGLSHCASIGEEAYDEERRALSSLGRIAV